MNKYIFTKGNDVIGSCVIADQSGNTKCILPYGVVEHIVEFDSPIDIGWLYRKDEASEKYSFVKPNKK